MYTDPHINSLGMNQHEVKLCRAKTLVVAFKAYKWRSQRGHVGNGFWKYESLVRAALALSEVLGFSLRRFDVVATMFLRSSMQI